jgi:dTMP kinase
MHLDRDVGRGFFLTLEGPEGSGKSTQAQLLATRLTSSGFRATVTREPGCTPLGEAVRQILLHDMSPVPTADAFLFNAARAQLVAEVIEPALARGEVVICDRFTDSTLAYQGYGAGQPLDELRDLARFATSGLIPDMTALIDLPIEDGLSRKVGGPEITRFELDADLAFHRRVREGFLAMAVAEPARFLVVDGRRSADLVEAEIAEELIVRIGRRDGLLRGAEETAARGQIASSSEPERASLRMDK